MSDKMKSSLFTLIKGVFSALVVFVSSLLAEKSGIDGSAVAAVTGAIGSAIVLS